LKICVNEVLGFCVGVFLPSEPERGESRMMKGMGELVFEAVQESDGGYCAECLTENIFTQGETWEELRRNVVDATAAFFFDQKRPETIRLHLVRDEVLSVA
jgi:predicted RNase H-like HicB family nuclease